MSDWSSLEQVTDVCPYSVPLLSWLFYLYYLKLPRYVEHFCNAACTLPIYLLACSSRNNRLGMTRYCPVSNRCQEYQENVLLARMGRDRIKSWRIRADTVANRDDGPRSKENVKINRSDTYLIFHFATIISDHSILDLYLCVSNLIITSTIFFSSFITDVRELYATSRHLEILSESRPTTDP